MSAPLRVRVQRLPHAHDLPLPAYQTDLAAGMDLAAAVEEELVLGPGSRCAVPTGLRLELPPGFEGQVRPRSGLARRHGLTVANAPGTIDADYRGELAVLLINLGPDPIAITRGMRIAQLVVAPVTRIAWEETADLSETARGEGGFGHTGLEAGRA